MKLVLKYCIQKELLNLKELKTFMAVRLVLSDRVTIIYHVAIAIAIAIIVSYSFQARLSKVKVNINRTVNCE